VWGVDAGQVTHCAFRFEWFAISAAVGGHGRSSSSPPSRTFPSDLLPRLRSMGHGLACHGVVLVMKH
jgi:hypothetical protein